MVLNHNLAAMNTSRMYKIVSGSADKKSEKLSSGYRINRAADDAAGLSISEKMRSMIRGLDRASDNAQDGISMYQVADGALNEVHSLLQRMKELSVQAANDTNTTIDRDALQEEVDELLVEINRIADTTEYNSMALLDGTFETASPNIISTPYAVSSLDKMISVNPIRDASASNVCTSAQLSAVENAVANMVPDAVQSILNTFGGSLGANLGSVSSEIGFKLYADNSSTLAYVAARYGYNGAGQLGGIALNLSVNVASLQFDAAGNLTNVSSESLKATIAHEMMHAFMDDVLPNGMLGASGGIKDNTNAFPGWFKEGMAQVTCGGYSNYNDWVNGGLGITTNSSDKQIENILKSSSNSLSSGTTASKYGTGYLATMYLGYMASGGTMSAGAIGGGLDSILKEIAGGKSLSDVIKDLPGGKYNSLADFQRKFGDADSVAFVKALTQTVGANGNGSVIAGNLAGTAVLNGMQNNTYYKIDINSPDEFKTSTGVHTFADGGSGGYSNAGGDKKYLQIGGKEGQIIEISIDDAHTMSLGLDSISLMNHESAGTSITAIDDAIIKVSRNRSRIGASMNRLEHVVANLDNTSENTQASESRIRDTDMASTMVEFSKDNILKQAGQSMLAQANQSPQGVLSLLQ